MSTPQDGESKKPVVPKFSSFKSSSTVPTSRPSARDRRRSTSPKHRKHQPEHAHRSKRRRRDDDEHQESARDDRKERKRSLRGDDHRLKDARESHRSSTRHSYEKSNPAHSRPKTQDQPRDPLKGVAGIYLHDVKGDPLLKKYGDDGRYRLPYRLRCLPGRALGADGRIYIHRDGFREQFTILAPGEKLAFFRDRDGLRSKRPATHPNPVRLRAPKGQQDEEEEDLSFIAIWPAKERKHHGAESESSDSEEEPSYRSIEGKMKAKNPEGEQSQSDEEPDELDLHAENPLRWRSVQLNRQVKEHPEDIDAWLELVDHQDALLADGYDIDHLAPVSEAHSYSEIKVSLLQKALEQSTSASDSTRIMVRLMREGFKIWDSKTAQRHWEAMEQGDKENFDIWMAYVDHRMSDITSFEFEAVKRILVDRLQYLRGEHHGPQTVEATQESIFVILRLTRLMADAGYRELAMSAWQALFEGAFFRPRDLRDPLPSFFDFWESEVPRIGEQGAKGWAQWDAANDLPPDPAPEPPEPILSSRDPYKVWASLESAKERAARSAARTMDEGTDDDPYRVVVFDDLRESFFMISEKHLDLVRHQLIDSFLVFSGLPVAYRDSPWVDRALQDQYVTGSLSDIELPTPQPDLTEDQGVKKPPKFWKPRLNLQQTTDTVFSKGSWFQYLPPKSSADLVSRDMIELVLSQLVFLADVSDLGQYYLAVVHSNNQAAVKKQAKALLKRHSVDPHLYKAYALAEYASGHTDVAKMVLGSAVSITKDTPLLQCTQAWLDLDAGSKSAALRDLCSWIDPTLVDDSLMAPIVLSSHMLKASNAFRSGFDASRHSENSLDAVLYAECLMLLSYFTNYGSEEPMSTTQGSITAAMEVIHQRASDMKAHPSLWAQGGQALLQSAAKLLYWHACNGPSRRAYLRQQLVGFLELFPSNGVFVTLLEWSDSSLRVIDDTRDIIYTKCLSRSNDCVSNRILAIQHEMDRGNANSTKTAFEHALSSDVCRASVPLWIWYIQFCYSEQSLRSKAKSVFHRALKQCPWAKRVMMQAFVTLARSMESDELRSVYSTMASKGMRIHIDLDDFIEEHRKKR